MGDRRSLISDNWQLTKLKVKDSNDYKIWKTTRIENKFVNKKV